MDRGGYDQRQERLANYSIKEQIEEEMKSEFAVVARESKGPVIEKVGLVSHDIMQKSGQIVSEQIGLTVSGDEEQRACARKSIEVPMSFGRSRLVEHDPLINLCYPSIIKLHPQVTFSYSPIYQSLFSIFVWAALGCIEDEVGANPKAEKRCRHFESATILVQHEEKVKWTIDETTGKFQSSTGEHYWKLKVKKELDPKDGPYVTRYDLTFIKPCMHQMRCKVWIADKKVRRTLDDIPSDIKNLSLSEIQFKNEATRTLCRGWLVLKFMKYLQADILFPGCEFDCRLIVCGRTVLPEILARDSLSLEAYKKALAYGETSVKRFPLTFIVRDQEGKTSLKKSLKRICFNREEGSSVGIDVNPSHFKVSIETWKTGTMNQDKICDAGIFCDYHTALIMGPGVVDSVKEKRSTVMETDTDESQCSFDFELNDVPGEPRLTESSKDAEHTQTSSDPEPTLSRHETHVSVDPREGSQEDVDFSTAYFPEGEAVVAESLLRGDLNDNGEDSLSTFWDFSGEPVYHNTHPHFFTARAIHCLAYKLNSHDKAKPLMKQGVLKEKQESFNLQTYLDDFCQTHHIEKCKEDQCHQFVTRSELCTSRHLCIRSTFAQNSSVHVMQFAPWFYTQGQQLAVGEGDGKRVSSDEENGEKVVALRYGVLKSFLSESCDCKQVVCRLKESLRLDTASLEQPAEQLIRCLARKTKCFNRLVVVKHLKAVATSGTTGPLFALDVRRIPISQREKLTIALSGGDEWMLVAEKLGLSHEEIRFFHKRTKNPADEVLSYIANQRYLTVGELYEVLCDCGLPAIADKLFLFSQSAVGERDAKRVSSNEENGEKVVALPDGVLKSFLSESFDSKQVVCESKDSLRLDTASLEQPAKPPIHCLARKTKFFNRLVVVKHLKAVATSGTTGPLFALDVRRIPLSQRGKLTIALSGGDEWMLVAEKLGLSHVEIRFFHKRTKNPADEVLSYIANQRYLTVGELYEVLCDCGLPAIADKLFLFSQSAVGERDAKRVSSNEENGEKVVAIPDGVLKSFMSESFDSKQVVCESKDSLRLDTASLEQPAKPLIHCLARKTKFFNRLVVVKHLKAVATSGTTGPLVSFDVRRIPISQRKNITIDLSGRDEWMFVAEKLGLSHEEIRFFHKRTKNPADELLSYIADQRYLTVGELYEVLCVCGLPAIAEKLFIFSQSAVGERDAKRVSSDEENGEKAVALPDGVLEALLSRSWNCKHVVYQLKGSLQLDTTSLEQPDPKTKKWIRCLAREAGCLNRLDVVKHLREITPAGTTGPLLCESLDVRNIPFSLERNLTMALSGIDEWKLVAEKLGLNPEEIRHLDKRFTNPVKALLHRIAKQRDLTVRELYEVLCNCGVPVIADKL